MLKKAVSIIVSINSFIFSVTHALSMGHISVNASINPDKNKGDLIHQMITFDKLEMRLLRSDQLDMNFACPIYHCVSGFNHPKLKPYLKIFNDGIVRDKGLILDTLNHDHNPERRAAASRLVAHLTSADEVMSILLDHVNDPSSLVRHNVIRVITATMAKARRSPIMVSSGPTPTHISQRSL